MSGTEPTYSGLNQPIKGEAAFIAPAQTPPATLEIIKAEKLEPDEHERAYLDDLAKALRNGTDILSYDHSMMASEEAKELGFDRKTYLTEKMKEVEGLLVLPETQIEYAAKFGRKELALDMINAAWDYANKHNVEFPYELPINALRAALFNGQNEMIDPLARSLENPKDAMEFIHEAQSSADLKKLTAIAKEYGVSDREIKDRLTDLYKSKIYSFVPDRNTVSDMLLELHRQGIRMPPECLTQEGCKNSAGSLYIDNEETRLRILRSVDFLDKAIADETKGRAVITGNGLTSITQCNVPTPAEIHQAKQEHGSFIIVSGHCEIQNVDLNDLEKSRNGLAQPASSAEREASVVRHVAALKPPGSK